MIKLGTKVRDKITGYTGIAIGRTEWLYGCATVGVKSSAIEAGKPVDAVWIDEQGLEEVEMEPVAKQGDTTPGGPRDTPTRVMGPR